MASADWSASVSSATSDGLRRSIALALAVLLCSCSRTAPAPQHHPVFPPAPAEAKVIHRATISGPATSSSPGVLARLAGVAAGRTKQELIRPVAVAHDGDRRLFVADMERQVVHVLDTHSGRGSLIARAGEQYLVSPAGVAVMDGRLAIADSALGRVFLLDGRDRLVNTIDDVQRPTGLHYDARRAELHVVDTLANQVRVYDRHLRLARVIGERGHGPGQFNYPTQVFVDADGQSYVTDSMNFRVQVFDPAGRYITHIGQLGDASGYLSVPKGVVVDRYGHIYVADSHFSNIQVYDQQGRFLLAIGGPGEDSGQFHLPVGMCMDQEDRFFVADSYNRRVQVFQYIGGPSDAQP